MNAIDMLKTATNSYDRCVQENGEIHDSVLGAPFQYGTPYYTVCNAVLAFKTAGAERDAHVQKALKGLEASLTHIVRIDLPPTPSHLWTATRARARRAASITATSSGRRSSSRT